jgi:hypothetical protein
MVKTVGVCLTFVVTIAWTISIVTTVKRLRLELPVVDGMAGRSV